MRTGPSDSIPRSRSAPTWFAGGIALIAFALALHFVVHYGTRVASLDDLTQVWALQPDFHPTLSWLWSQHNEHRMPLPRILYWLLVRGARDFRAGTLFDLTILTLVVAASMAAARRIRGSSRVADAFFPLVWFSWMHAENLLNSFQLTLVLTSALLCVATIAIASGSPSLRSTVTTAVCACLLPLCSLGGVIEATFLSAWLGFVWWSARRADTTHQRRTGTIAAIGATTALAIVTSTFLGFALSQGAQRPTLGRALAVMVQFLASPVGWIGPEVSAWAGPIAAVMIAAGIFALARIAQSEPAERTRSLGLIAILISVVVLAASIGIGRGSEDEIAGTRSRYAMLAVPWTCALYFAAVTRDRVRTGSTQTSSTWKSGTWKSDTAQLVLFALAALLFTLNLRPGAQSGEERVRAADSIERDVARGRSYAQVSAGHWRDVYYGEPDYRDVLSLLDRAGLAPFERSKGPDANLLIGTDPCDDTFRRPLIDHAEFRPLARRIDDVPVVLLGQRSELEWPVPPDATAVRGSFCVHPKTWSQGAVRFAVRIVDEEERDVASFERVLDPAHLETDRGFVDFGLAFDPGQRHRLIVRTTGLAETSARQSWGCWSELRLR